MKAETVLIVEPHEWQLKLLEYNLSKRNYRVVTEADYRAALDRAGGEPPAAIILALQTGSPIGFKLLKALRARASTAAVPILVTLAEPGAAAAAQATAAGATVVLPKPYRLDDLLNRLDHLLKHRSGVELQPLKGGYLIELVGTVHSTFGADLKKIFDTALAEPEKLIILDFSQVRFFDNRHLVLLGAALSRARYHRSEIRIAAPLFGIITMFERSGLHGQLEIYPTVAAAVAGRAPGSGG